MVIFFILHTDEHLSVVTLFTRQQHLCSHPKPSLPVELWVPSFLPSQDQFLQGQSHQCKKHFHISLFIKWKNSLSYILLQPTLISSALLQIKTFQTHCNFGCLHFLTAHPTSSSRLHLSRLTASILPYPKVLISFKFFIFLNSTDFQSFLKHFPLWNPDS